MYFCPECDYQSDELGRCPQCNLSLVADEDHHNNDGDQDELDGYGFHEEDDGELREDTDSDEDY